MWFEVSNSIFAKVIRHASALWFEVITTSLRFAPASALLSHPEKDLLGPFLYPFGALRVGFDNRAISNQVSSGGARSYINS